jgi:hypothetical protein
MLNHLRNITLICVPSPPATARYDAFAVRFEPGTAVLTTTKSKSTGNSTAGSPPEIWLLMQIPQAVIDLGCEIRGYHVTIVE